MSDIVPRSESHEPKQLSGYRLTTVPPHVSIVAPRQVPSVAPSRLWYPMVASIVFLCVVIVIQIVAPSSHHHSMSTFATGALVSLFGLVALIMLWPDLSRVIKQRVSRARRARASRQDNCSHHHRWSAKQDTRDRAA